MYGKSILWDMVDKLLKRDLICTKYFRREDSLKIEAIFLEKCQQTSNYRVQICLPIFGQRIMRFSCH